MYSAIHVIYMFMNIIKGYCLHGIYTVAENGVDVDVLWLYACSFRIDTYSIKNS
jgi:hypothetical protein